MHPNLQAKAKRNAEIVRSVEAGQTISFVSRAYGLTPASVRQIVQKSKQPVAPFGLSKNAVTVIRKTLKIERRPLRVHDVITFVEQGHLHTRHPNFGTGSVDAISSAFMAYREDKTVLSRPLSGVV